MIIVETFAASISTHFQWDVATQNANLKTVTLRFSTRSSNEQNLTPNI